MKRREIVARVGMALVVGVIGGWVGYGVAHGSISIAGAILIMLLVIPVSAVIATLIKDPWVFRP